MDTIEIQTADGTADARVARPDADEYPGVLFFMDAIGVRPQIEQMAQRIAAWGYVVLVPNLFYRDGTAGELAPTVDLTVQENREEFMAGALKRVQDLTDDQALPDIRAYIDALQAQDGVIGGSIGTTGYCMGGRLSFVTACEFGDEIAAAGAFHAGGLVTDAHNSPHTKAPGATASLYFGHADQDPANSAEAISSLEAALTEANADYTSQIYTGAAHGYTMADMPAYDSEAGEKHFIALCDLFARTLG